MPKLMSCGITDEGPIAGPAVQRNMKRATMKTVRSLPRLISADCRSCIIIVSEMSHVVAYAME